MTSLEPGFSRDYLREQTRWIRDVLDPQVAQDGPDALHSDEILTLDEFLRHLLSSGASLEDIRFSRMHRAEAQYGPLGSLGFPLYEPGGRLHGVCEANDLSKEQLLVKWLKTPDTRLSPAVARKRGDLGFTPGDWWISPLFAFRAGIIDSADALQCIVCDSRGAYAIVMGDGDEIPAADPETFQYIAKPGDMGRYRLTAANQESRQPVRILRHHSLHSLWKPKAGLRYDGLHRVTGWTIKMEPKTGQAHYIIGFRRLASEVPMAAVLNRPWSDEVEDYMEYKRIRRQVVHF